MLPRGGRNGRRNTDLFKLRALEERTTLDLKCVGNLCLRVCCLGDPLSRLSVCASALILSRYTIHNLYTSPIKKGQCKYRIVSVSAEPLIHYVNRMCHVSSTHEQLSSHFVVSCHICRNYPLWIPTYRNATWAIP